MNERIKLLALQATSAVTKPDGHYIVQAWQAKFAELIVEECCKQIMYSSVSHEDPVFAYEYVKQLKTTFGVAE